MKTKLPESGCSQPCSFAFHGDYRESECPDCGTEPHTLTVFEIVAFLSLLSLVAVLVLNGCMNDPSSQYRWNGYRSVGANELAR